MASIPEFWKSRPEQIDAFFGASGATYWEIGKSSGGRPVMAAAYGEKESRERRMPFHSAVSHGEANEAFFGEKRKKPVLFIAATVHGAEVEGTVTAVNFASVLETGKDLRGKEWPRLRELGLQHRIVILPLMTPDGRAHFEGDSLVGEPPEKIGYHGQGQWNDGSPIRYDGPYHHHPLKMDDVKFLGGYFNDAGVNLMYDDWFGDPCPETKAWLSLARDEAPDCVLNLHSCGAGPFFNPGDQFIPEAFRQRQNAASERVALRMEQEGLRPVANRPTLRSLGLCLYNVWYFVCGCLPLTFEYPHGVTSKPFTHDEILDIGLIMFEEVLDMGVHHGGYRPGGWKWNRGGREW